MTCGRTLHGREREPSLVANEGKFDDTRAGGSLPFFCKYRSKCRVRGER